MSHPSFTVECLSQRDYNTPQGELQARSQISIRRAPFLLTGKYFLELDNRELADMPGMTEGALRMALFRARNSARGLRGNAGPGGQRRRGLMHRRKQFVARGAFFRRSGPTYVHCPAKRLRQYFLQQFAPLMRLYR